MHWQSDIELCHAVMERVLSTSSVDGIQQPAEGGVCAEQRLNVAAEELPLQSSVEVDSLLEVEAALDNTPSEAPAEMPGKRVRLLLVRGAVSICGELGELLLRWYLKATASCVQVSTHGVCFVLFLHTTIYPCILPPDFFIFF